MTRDHHGNPASGSPLHRLSLRHWHIEWLLLPAAALALAISLSADDTPTPQRASIDRILRHGEIAQARIDSLIGIDLDSTGHGFKIGVARHEYRLALSWIDYHKARQTISGLRLSDGDIERLNLLGSQGELARQTLLIRYELPSAVTADEVNANVDASMRTLPESDRIRVCVPAALCEHVVIPEVVDAKMPESSLASMFWFGLISAALFVLMLICRVLGVVNPPERV